MLFYILFANKHAYFLELILVFKKMFFSFEILQKIHLFSPFNSNITVKYIKRWLT